MTDLARLVEALSALRGKEAPRLLAVGWATVDLERTLDHLGLGDAGPIVEEPLLGGRARLVEAASSAVLVLEPITEGRLAAALARRGEGICALYVAGDRPLSGGAPRTTARTTALGLPGRLLSHDHPWGPFVIEVTPG